MSRAASLDGREVKELWLVTIRKGVNSVISPGTVADREIFLPADEGSIDVVISDLDGEYVLIAAQPSLPVPHVKLTFALIMIVDVSSGAIKAGVRLGERTRVFPVRWIIALVVIAIAVGSPAAATAQQREQVATIASYSAFQTAVLFSGFVPESYVVPTIMAGSLLQTAPLWALSVPEGAIYTGLTAAGFGGYFLAPEESILGDSLGDFGIKMGLWSNYRTYAAYRELAEPGWQPERFVDLMTAPFDWNDLNNPAVWTVLAAGTLVNVGFNLLSADDGQAVWDTRTSYLGDVEVAPVLGVAAALGIGILNNTFTGATEEALYRGVQYEALQNRFGRGAARWIDGLAFAGIHVPGDIYRGEDPVSIGLTFAYRLLVSLGLQWAYDAGGLQSAAALHTWLNVGSEVAEFLVSSGVSRSERNASMSISPMSISLSIPY